MNRDALDNVAGEWWPFDTSKESEYIWAPTVYQVEELTDAEIICKGAAKVNPKTAYKGRSIAEATTADALSQDTYVDVSKRQPSYLHIPLCILAAMAGGGLWALLPGYLKAARGCHEVIVTIMMNYIAFRVSAYFLNGPMQAQGANIAASENLQQSAWLPQLVPGTRLSIGILLAVVLAVLLWYILKYTRPGYKVKAVGLNADAARYAGVSIKKTIILTMLISGAIAGIAGGAEILGVHHRVYDQFSPGYGFDSIAVALLGYNNPLGVVISGFLFGSLKSGSVNMQTVAGTSKDLVRVIQAVIIFFSVTGFSFQKIVHWIRKKCKENPRQKRPVTKKGGEAP